MNGARQRGTYIVSTTPTEDGEQSAEQRVPESTESADLLKDGTDIAPRRSHAVALQSLAPQYEEDQHGTYVARLEEAVRDPKNLNIALTGRYGSGKSSVLDEFEAKHKRRTLRLAISTLAPEDLSVGEPTPPPGARLSTTNRIQKEVVKQLVYGASRKVGKNSRFSRIAVPSKTKVFAQFALALAFVGAMFFALDRLPKMRTFFEGQATWTPYAAWAVLGLAAAGLLTAVRLSLHGQFRIADVKAGGASVSLTEQAPSYFDKYLDELVHYFDQESKDIVILEDLDRFEDPRIFEALRELNILLNDTPGRRRRRRGSRAGRAIAWVLGGPESELVNKARRQLSMEWGTRLLGTGVPLRFVYAVKDSLFEQLGTDTAALVEAGDVAAAETLRANRTKFFDVVVPLVPFISHRNARELLSGLLLQAGINDVIDRRLQAVVAKHATDMRLLRNICNEYLVFAERLLESDRVAPKLDHSKLFALVAYKNFHLTDFELIARRGSVLDDLYDHKTELVRDEITTQKAAIRSRLAEPAAEQQKALAESLGAKLVEVGRVARASAGYPGDSSPLEFTVDGTDYTENELFGYEFWVSVAEHGTMSTRMPNNRHFSITRENLGGFLPELGDPSSWREVDETARQRDVAARETTIEQFRGADFIDLIRLTARAGTGQVDAAATTSETSPSSELAEPSATTTASKNFAGQVDAIMPSDLARDLVKGGFIDQNFTLYAAQFYGTFVGVDVARFMVHNVQPNVMTVDYPFTTPGAVDNLLAEADDEFLHTAAAFNVDIVDHLLATNHPGVGPVVTRLTDNPDDDALEFLAAFFTSSKTRREDLAARLACEPWVQVFAYLSSSGDVPTDVRPALVSAALGAADGTFAYTVDGDFRKYLELNYLDMPVFTRDQAPEVTETVAAVLAQTGAVIPVLDAVRELRLRRKLVTQAQYKLTAANLRTAITTPGPSSPISFDRVLNDDDVFEYCLEHPGPYLEEVQNDDATNWAVESPATLAFVLTAITDAESDTLLAPWRIEDLKQMLTLSAPESALAALSRVPTSTWPALAEAGLFTATLANVEKYRAALGIDASLAGLLTDTGHIIDDAPEVADATDAPDEVKGSAALALLNAPILTTSVRVALVKSLSMDRPVPAESITVEEDDLFARLLNAGLVADDKASFLHFRAGGWSAIGPALAASPGIATFIDPAIVQSMVGDLLADVRVSGKLGDIIVEHAEEFIPDDDDSGNDVALGALAAYADRRGKPLSPVMVQRIARGRVSERSIILRLLSRTFPAATTRDFVSVFTELGGEYAKVTGGPNTVFEVLKDEVHEALLATLKAGGILKYEKIRRQDRYRVEVLTHV